MPNIKSQKKRVLTNEKARQRNVAVRSRLRTLARGFNEAVEAGDRDKAAAALKDACQAYDKAAAKGVLHKNNAANHKAQLAARFNALDA